MAQEEGGEFLRVVQQGRQVVRLGEAAVHRLVEGGEEGVQPLGEALLEGGRGVDRLEEFLKREKREE